MLLYVLEYLEMSGWYEFVEGVLLGTGDRQHAPVWYILTTLTTVSLVRAMKRHMRVTLIISLKHDRWC